MEIAQDLVDDRFAAANVPTTPTVLIAVDDVGKSVRIAEIALRLFGKDAQYLVMNVGDIPVPSMTWGFVYPNMVPLSESWALNANNSGFRQKNSRQAEHRSELVAEQEATAVADAAHLPNAVDIGEIGDPATAILDAAGEHGADVIVIGSRTTTWFARLFTASVGHELVANTDTPVLVVSP